MAELVPMDEAARRLACSKRSLADLRWRTKVGLPAIRIGRRLSFSEADLDRVIAARREQLVRTRDEATV